MLSYKNFSWVYKDRGQRPDGTYNCFYAAAVEVILNGGQLMRGPSAGHKGETAHFWVERDGKIIDPTEAQYVDLGGYPHYNQGEEVSVEDNLDAVMNDPLFEQESQEIQDKVKARLQT